MSCEQNESSALDYVYMIFKSIDPYCMALRKGIQNKIVLDDGFRPTNPVIWI